MESRVNRAKKSLLIIFVVLLFSLFLFFVSCDSSLSGSGNIVETPEEAAPSDPGTSGGGGGGFTPQPELKNDLFEKSNTELEVRSINNPSALASEIKSKGYTTVVLSDSITTIPAKSFLSCSSLTEVAFTDNVIKIGEDAFAACTGLTKVIVPDSVTSIGVRAFSDCTSLEEVTLPAGMTTIANQLFQNDKALTTVNIGSVNTEGPLSRDASENKIQVVGDFAFYGCEALSDWSMFDSLVSIGNGAFGDTGFTEVVLPETLKELSEMAFEECEKLDEFTFPACLNEIPEYFFLNAKAPLTNLVIPNNYISIGANAFSGCTGLKSIAFPNQLESIGISAFYQSGLKGTLNIPASVTEIESFAFKECNEIENIVINGCPNIANNVFEEMDRLKTVTINGNGFLSLNTLLFGNCSALTSFSAKDVTITNIGAQAFYNCGALKTINISATSSNLFIGDSAFRWCSSLQTAEGITNNAIYIGSYAFYGCSSITKAPFSKNINFLGDHAFYECKMLESVDLSAAISLKSNPHSSNDSENNLLEQAFTGCESITEARLPNHENFKNIPFHIFDGCKNLTSIQIPNYIETIEEFAFNNCENLKSITFVDKYGSKSYGYGSNLKVIKAAAFDHCTSLFKDSNEESFTLPNSVIYIGDAVFLGCPLSVIDLSQLEGLTHIGDYAFSYNDILYSITLPSNLETIGGHAFFGDDNLQKVVIPSSVTSIGEDAFGSCSYNIELKLMDLNLKDTPNYPWGVQEGNISQAGPMDLFY